MIWRIALTGLYAAAFGGLLAFENVNPGMSDTPLLVLWIAAPVVGLLVGRWWVLLAVVGAMIGHVVGWDAGENDGNPALWPPYLVMWPLLLGLPLCLGVAFSRFRSDRAPGPRFPDR